MRSNIMTVDKTRNEVNGNFYNFYGLFKGKYGTRVSRSRWEILRTGLGTEFQFGRRYFTIKLAG